MQFSQKEAENLEQKASRKNEEFLENTAQIGASEDNLGEAEFKKVPEMLLVLVEAERNLKMPRKKWS